MKLKSPLYFIPHFQHNCANTLAMLKICWWTNQIKKNNASTNTNFRFSSRVYANNLFFQGQIETIRGQSNSVFILFFYIFLFWYDWTHVLPESQLSVKHAFMQIFLGSLHIYVTLAKTLTMNLNNVMLLYPRLTGKCGEEEHWSTQKLADQKGNRSLEVSVCTDNSAFLHHYTNKLLCISTNT